MVISIGSSAIIRSAAPTIGVPCNGVNSPKNTTRSGTARVPAARRTTSLAPRPRPPRCRPAWFGPASARCSSVSTTTRSAHRIATRSSARSARSTSRFVTPRSNRGLLGADQQVEDDRHAAEQAPSEHDVEMAEEPDEHDVWSRPGARRAEQAPPRCWPAADAQHRQPPRLAQRRHALRRRQASGSFASVTSCPAASQPLDQHRDARVDGGVVRPERQHPHEQQPYGARRSRRAAGCMPGSARPLRGRSRTNSAVIRARHPRDDVAAPAQVPAYCSRTSCAPRRAPRRRHSRSRRRATGPARRRRFARPTIQQTVGDHEIAETVRVDLDRHGVARVLDDRRPSAGSHDGWCWPGSRARRQARARTAPGRPHEPDPARRPSSGAHRMRGKAVVRS